MCLTGHSSSVGNVSGSYARGPKIDPILLYLLLIQEEQAVDHLLAKEWA